MALALVLPPSPRGSSSRGNSIFAFASSSGISTDKQIQRECAEARAPLILHRWTDGQGGALIALVIYDLYTYCTDVSLTQHQISDNIFVHSNTSFYNSPFTHPVGYYSPPSTRTHDARHYSRYSKLTSSHHLSHPTTALRTPRSRPTYRFRHRHVDIGCTEVYRRNQGRLGGHC